MNMKAAFQNIKSNHLLLMVICCALPLIVLAALTYFFGLSKSYLFWAAILICPLAHIIMMKEMHKEHKHDKEKEACH